MKALEGSRRWIGGDDGHKDRRVDAGSYPSPSFAEGPVVDIDSADSGLEAAGFRTRRVVAHLGLGFEAEKGGYRRFLDQEYRSDQALAEVDDHLCIHIGADFDAHIAAERVETWRLLKEIHNRDEL